MSGRYLLDTNIVIALFANEASVKNALAKAEEVFIPSIVFGELYYGASKSGRPKQNSEKIDDLVSQSSIIVVDVETARRYGEIKNTLRLKGRPLPENDIWIAALALQYNLILVTRDAHFQEIDRIETDFW